MKSGKPIIKNIFFLLTVCHLNFYCNKNQIIDSLKIVLQKTSQDTVRVKLLNDIGGYLISDRNYTEAMTYLNKAQQLAENIYYYKGLSISFNRKGIVYLNENNNTQALDYFSKAKDLFLKTNDKKGLADVIGNIGIIYSEMGKYANALENHLAALKIREEIQDYKGISASMMSVANIYYLQNKFTTALDLYLKILKNSGVVENKYFYAEVLYNIGLTYIQLKDYSKALNYLNSALEIDKEIDDKQGVALVYTNIGSVYSKMGNYKNALDFTMDGFNILKSLNDKKGITETYGELGIIYDSLKLYDKAIDCFKNQLNFAGLIGSKQNTKQGYLYLSNHYCLVNNYKDGYDNYKLFKSVGDSINNESSNKSIVELETKYETQNKEREIKLLKIEQELQMAENTKQKQLIYGLFIFAVIISLSIFLFYNRQQLKKKNILEKKNFELERSALSAQMNPHFIFNSLGSISGFISENDKDKAIEYLAVFSRLIRHNLEQSRAQLVSVIQEAKMLQSYLFLQKLRYNDKFNFQFDIDESMDASIAIPPMFIQPFIENAILHGVIPKAEVGNILVKFYLTNNQELICEVKDDGIGKTESLSRKSERINIHKSLAMTITEERMQNMNSINKQKIQLIMSEIVNDNNTVEGTLVKLIFPIDYI